jgi:hypothetical protein
MFADYDNIINIELYRFPARSKAMHPVYGLCSVIELMGNKRKIVISRLNTVEIELVQKVVHVNTLKSVILPDHLKV